MAYEERRVVTDGTEPAVVEDAATTEPVVTNTVPADGVVSERVVRQPAVEPATVVQRRTPTRVIETADDPLGNVYAASQLIQTIVWSVVVIVLLVVALLALHVYAHLF